MPTEHGGVPCDALTMLRAFVHKTLNESNFALGCVELGVVRCAGLLVGCLGLAQALSLFCRCIKRWIAYREARIHVLRQQGILWRMP